VDFAELQGFIFAAHVIFHSASSGVSVRSFPRIIYLHCPVSHESSRSHFVDVTQVVCCPLAFSELLLQIMKCTCFLRAALTPKTLGCATCCLSAPCVTSNYLKETLLKFTLMKEIREHIGPLSLSEYKQRKHSSYPSDQQTPSSPSNPPSPPHSCPPTPSYSSCSTYRYTTSESKSQNTRYPAWR